MNNIKEYAQLKIKEKEIQDRLNELKAEITTIVFEEDNQSLETEWGKFEIRSGRKTWKYSDELTLKETQVKEMFKAKKKQEELSGTAELLKAPTNLVFTARKGE